MIAPEVRAQLTELVNRYSFHADRAEFDELARLFTEDAVLLVPDPPRTLLPAVEARGRSAIAGACRGLTRMHVTRHSIGGAVFFDAGGEAAVGVIAGSAHHVAGAAGEVTDHVWHLHYRDRYLRVDGGWLIARRALYLDWIEQRPVVQYLSRADALAHERADN